MERLDGEGGQSRLRFFSCFIGREEERAAPAALIANCPRMIS
jgi:hypothetical protein